MAKKPSQQWIFSVVLPDQAREERVSKPSDTEIFDVLGGNGYLFSPCTDVSNILPYYWTDLARAVEDIIRRKNTSSFSETEESYLSLFSLKDLICRPDQAYQFYKEYPQATSATSGEFIKHLADRFNLLVQRDLVRFQSGLALILNNETDEDTSIRDMLRRFSLFQWGEGTICEKSRNVDVDDKAEIDAVTSYLYHFLPQATRFVPVRYWGKLDNRFVQAYKNIGERCRSATEEHSACVVVPMFLEIPNNDQNVLHSILSCELQSLEEETIVLLIPSQLLVDRSLKTLQDVNDFFNVQKFNSALFKNECKVIIKSYGDPAVETISMLVIEIYKTAVNTDRHSRFVETSAPLSATLNPEHLNDGSSESVHVASDDGKDCSFGDSSFGARSVEASKEADKNMDNTSVPFDLPANESGEDTKDDDNLSMDSATSSSQSQQQGRAFTALMKKALSSKKRALSDKRRQEEQRKLDDEGKRRGWDNRPLRKFLNDKENEAFLVRKREGEQLTWLQWALRCAVVARGRRALHVTQLLIDCGNFTDDQMFQESLLMTCVTEPHSWSEVPTALLKTFEVRSGEKDDEGRTVLHLAVQKIWKVAVEDICERNPEMKQEKDQNGKTPLDYAMEVEIRLKEKSKSKQETESNQAEEDPAESAGPSRGPLAQIAKIIVILKEGTGTARSDKRPNEKQSKRDHKRRRDSNEIQTDTFEDY